MPDDAVTKLLKQSSISFVGTVERLGASTMTDVPIDNHTAVVRVDQVLHAPDAFVNLAGSPVTVQLAAKPALPKEGEQYAFFANGAAFGAGIAVSEVGRVPASQVAPHLALAASTGAGAFADIQAGIEAQQFRDHVKDAAAVVLGRVTGLQKAAPVAFSEHDPDWWIATIDAYQVVAGPGAEARHDRGPLPEQPRRAVAQLAEAEGRTGRAVRPPCQRPLGPVAGEVPAPPSRRPAAGAERRCPHERKEPMSIRVVNMIPASLSGETSQDSEPNIAVNPQNTKAIVGTAFTPAPTGGSFAPIYISSDGGNTWALRMVVPGNGFVGNVRHHGRVRRHRRSSLRRHPQRVDDQLPDPAHGELRVGRPDDGARSPAGTRISRGSTPRP